MAEGKKVAEFDQDLEQKDSAAKDGYFYLKKTYVLAFVLMALLAIVLVGVIVGLLVPDNVSDSSPNKGDEENTTKLPLSSTTAITNGCEDPGTDEPWYNVRLPENVLPRNYDLTLQPNLETNNFTGEVGITVEVISSTKYLMVQVKDIVMLRDPIVTNIDGKVLTISDHFEYTCNEYYVLEMKESLDPGFYLLSMAYGGSLTGEIVGFYKSTYTTSNGEERSLATSKFQPTDARQAYPCFDEPKMKATYKTTLIHGDQRFALSNMPVNKTVEIPGSNGLFKSIFELSVPMSTYLTCFIVSDFSFTNITTNNNIPMRIFTTKDQINQTLYALDLGKEITDFYEEYFNVSYPLPKLDMAAIPDYPSGATEHWGLVTYRESNLLYDEENSSENNKQRVASVVGHELAHMWFGNLVTNDWWNDLWLQEGFASFLEYYGVDAYHPDWDMANQFLVQDMFYVFGLDQIISSHPIILPVNHPDEINEIFDSISYSKGASIIRMLEAFMGQDNFKTGLSNYLTKFSFDTTVTNDLWSSLDEQFEEEEINIKEIMDTWTLQMGFPVVTLTRQSDGSFKAEQKHFLIDPNADIDQSEYISPFDYTWYIPFTYMSETQMPTSVWMKKGPVTITLPPNDKRMVANLNRKGYYRVNYDPDTWNTLSKELQSDFSALDIGDRSGLIDDAFSLARANQLSYDVGLELINYLRNETEYVPWETASDSLQYLTDMMYNRESYGLLTKYIRNLVKAQADRLDFVDGGEHLDKYLRNVVLSLSCGNGDRDCLSSASDWFDQYLNGESLPTDLRSLVYEFGISIGGRAEWDYMWNDYLNEELSQERSRLLYALAQTRTPWLISRYLEYTRDENKIREQDFFSVLRYIGYNPVGNPIVWDWTRENWEYMENRFGLGNRYFGQLIPDITENFNTNIQLKEMENFFLLYPDAGAGERGRTQALETVQNNIDWLERYEDSISYWLEENVSS